jgi:hypothetical protein
MDSNDEMTVQLVIQEEVECSRKGKRKNKNYHLLRAAEILEDDYFKNDPTHGPKTFRRSFWMNKELFMKTVQGVKELTIASTRYTALDWLVSLLLRSARQLS